MTKSKLIFLFSIFTASLFAQTNCDDYPKKYIPIDLNDALHYLDCKWSESDKNAFKDKPINDATAELHFGTGRAIRNSWGLWKGNSEIAKYFHDLGIYHPDGMSGIILTSFHRQLNHIDIGLEEQIADNKAYWKNSEQNEIKRKKEELGEFKVGDTIEFSYNYDFVSKKQEKKWLDDICLAKGIVSEKDTVDFKLKVKLIESCDKKGIIILRSYVFKETNTKEIIKKKVETEIMKEGDTKWTSYDLWYLIE